MSVLKGVWKWHNPGGMPLSETQIDFISNSTQYSSMHGVAGAVIDGKIYYWGALYDSTYVAFKESAESEVVWVDERYQIFELTSDLDPEAWVAYLIQNNATQQIIAQTDKKYVIDGSVLVNIGKVVSNLLGSDYKIALSDIPGAIEQGKEKQYNDGFQALLNQIIDPDGGYIVQYLEFIDSDENSEERIYDAPGDKLIGPSYEYNNEHILVPVLYNFYSRSSGTGYDIDKYYYMGQVIVKDPNTETDIEYDKWRKIEPGEGYNWYSSNQVYAYTERIIV